LCAGCHFSRILHRAHSARARRTKGGVRTPRRKERSLHMCTLARNVQSSLCGFAEPKGTPISRGACTARARRTEDVARPSSRTARISHMCARVGNTQAFSCGFAAPMGALVSPRAHAHSQIERSVAQPAGESATVQDAKS